MLPKLSVICHERSRENRIYIFAKLSGTNSMGSDYRYCASSVKNPPIGGDAVIDIFCRVHFEIYVSIEVFVPQRRRRGVPGSPRAKCS